MTRIRSHTIWSIGILVLAGGLLTGCPKRPEVRTALPPPATAGGSATGVGGASGGAIGGSTVDSGTGLTQSGAGAAGAGAAAATGGAGATGAGGPGGQTGTAGGAAGTGGAAGAGAMGGAGTGDAGAAGGAGQPATDGGMTASAATGSGSSTGGSSTGGSGLPAGPPTGTTLPLLPSPAEFVEAKELGDIHFDFDKADVRAADRTVLEGNAAWLRANAKTQVLVEGHCDERGTNEYNLALGERRAKATRDYLASVGVDAARVTVISYGKERPFCNDANEACWGKNRRAHFLVKQ